MDFILANLLGIGGLIAGIGTFLTGLAAIITAWREKAERKGKEHEMHKQSKIEKTLWSIGGISILISISIFVARAAESDKPLNEQLVEAAWRSFGTKDYSLATKKCTELVDEFRPSADREQSTLEQKKTPMPVKGKPQEIERKFILERGLLNDVATCYFIIGRSQEFQLKTELARDAYSRAAKYTYARTWDPKGWFWSPSEAAQDRMSGLK